MMKHHEYNKNKYVVAFVKMVLILAFIHIFVLFVYCLKTGSLEALSIFHILSFNLLFPNILLDKTNLVYSVLFIAFVYFVILNLLNKKK